MAKVLPLPDTPPSTQALRVIRALRALAERPANTPDEYVQIVVDIHHVEAAIREVVDPAYYRAVSTRHGGVSYREVARRTGLAKSAVQRRVGLGAEAAGEAAGEG